MPSIGLQETTFYKLKDGILECKRRYFNNHVEGQYVTDNYYKRL